jgi:hypothetical protein
MILAIWHSRSLVNLEVKAQEIFKQEGLSIIQQVFGGDLGQVSLIRDHVDGMWSAF